MKLYTKLSFIIFSLIFSVGLIFSLLLSELLDRELEALILSQTKQQVLVFSSGVTREIQTMSVPNSQLLRDLLDNALKFDQTFFDFVVKSLILIGSDFEVIAYAGEAEIDADETEDYRHHPDIRQAIVRDMIYISPRVETYETHGRLSHSIDVVQPIHASGKVSGALEVQIDVSRSLSKMNERYARFKILIISLVVIGLILIVSLIYVFLKRIVIEPILELKSVTDQVRAGDLTVHVQPHGENEIGALGRSFNAMVDGLRERIYIKELFGRYVSKEIRDEILKGRIELSGERRRVTILFLDIKDFTRFSSRQRSEDVVVFLNEFFSVMVESVDSHDGIVNKYIGDSILAVFGAPIQHENHAANAMLAGLDMFSRLGEFNRKRRARGDMPIGIRIGIHTGEVIAGSIGSKERLEYTVIGDTVNRASRIEQLGKELQRDFLVSQETLDSIADRILTEHRIRIHGPYLEGVKGLDGKVTVYAVDAAIPAECGPNLAGQY